MKILSIFGTRPEAIKMAPLVRLLAQQPTIESLVCVTAQHRQMLDQVLELFAIRPDFDLSLMKSHQNLADLTSAILQGVGTILRKVRPDRVLVHGDTTTTLATSLAAYYEKIPVAHVEAGLRSGNIYAPWPEEINRKLVSSIADLHFAPTVSAQENLLKEGALTQQIFITGNTVIDALHQIRKKIESDQQTQQDLNARFTFLNPSLKLLVVTGHRRENWGDGMEKICKGLRKLAERDDVEIVYPVHLNPRIQEPVKQILGNHPKIHLLDPLDYLPFVYLMNRAYIVLTDSGGIQEEAPSLGKPVLVMREVTERPEAVQAGTVELVGVDDQHIYRSAARLLEDPVAYARMSHAHNPYGDGHASQRIIEVLLHGKFQ